jgi:drug/metabolite transporter superfamily protein YnfA
VILGSYGVVVNLIPLDLSRLLGAYVGFFALVSVLYGRFVFREEILPSTWIGLALVVAGSLVIQHGFQTRH